MLTKEGRYPSEYAATNPSQEENPIINSINFSNGELFIIQTRKKVSRHKTDYFKEVSFHSKLGDVVTIYTENKLLVKKKIPIFVK